MNRVPVSTLIDKALDFAVGELCEWNGKEFIINSEIDPNSYEFAPSTNWKHGGAVISICGLEIYSLPGVVRDDNPNGECLVKLVKSNIDEGPAMHGPTFLIAAMRAYVGYYNRNGFLLPKHILKNVAKINGEYAISAAMKEFVSMTDSDSDINMITKSIAISRIFQDTAKTHLAKGDSEIDILVSILCELTGKI